MAPPEHESRCSFFCRSPKALSVDSSDPMDLSAVPVSGRLGRAASMRCSKGPTKTCCTSCCQECLSAQVAPFSSLLTPLERTSGWMKFWPSSLGLGCTCIDEKVRTLRNNSYNPTTVQPMGNQDRKQWKKRTPISSFPGTGDQPVLLFD